MDCGATRAKTRPSNNAVAQEGRTDGRVVMLMILVRGRGNIHRSSSLLERERATSQLFLQGERK